MRNKNRFPRTWIHRREESKVTSLMDLRVQTGSRLERGSSLQNVEKSWVPRKWAQASCDWKVIRGKTKSFHNFFRVPAKSYSNLQARSTYL